VCFAQHERKGQKKSSFSECVVSNISLSLPASPPFGCGFFQSFGTVKKPNYDSFLVFHLCVFFISDPPVTTKPQNNKKKTIKLYINFLFECSTFFSFFFSVSLFAVGQYLLVYSSSLLL